MLFFGFGTRSKKWIFGNSFCLVAEWDYVDFFMCPLALSIKWKLIGDKRSEDRQLTYKEVKEMFPVKTPKVGKLDRFGLLYVIAACFIFVEIFL